LTTRLDGIGNVFGRLEGTSQSLSPVVVGSHLDSVPDGGRFDGSLGVVAALEVAAVLRDHHHVTMHPIDIVSFACEESSRFGRGTLGSGLVAGIWDPQELLELRDARGMRVRQVLQRVGLDPAQIATSRRAPGEFAAYLEVHIEQGRVLEESGVQVGIVDVIAAPTRFRLHIIGRADHSGATPMSLRYDALAGAADVILAVEQSAKAVTGVVGTVGTVRVEPGAINVVPGRVELGIDIRATDGMAKRSVVADLQERIRHITKSRDLSTSIEMLSDEEPVPMDLHVMALFERCCHTQHISFSRMPSGAGHDAMHMTRLCPSGMVLVPSREGISHDAAEWTDLDDIVAGVQILVDAALTIAEGQSLSTIHSVPGSH
ncbi:MAG: M20 family metallo-hydrolase, partial [Chloroflexota bacterium]|nr:M20 family metallo-hydrolase [Chloroflexota bacterium]